MQPVIGVTIPNRIFHPAYQLIKLCVRMAGGRVKALKEIESVERVDVDGLILGGGTDIFPALFQNDPKQNYLYDHDRDEMEMAWLRKAETLDLPVLGICRGAQMMNVMDGGTLHIDVSLAYENAHYPRDLLRMIFFRKSVYIEENSLLHRLVGAKHLRLNSMHTQSVDKLGGNLKISAREKNGVIQGIERPDHRFYLGVQFHPEFLFYRPTMRALFKGLIDESRNTR